jgi:hypothetical protein
MLTFVPHPTRRPIATVTKACPDVDGIGGYLVRSSGRTTCNSGKLAIMPAKNAATPTVGFETSRRMYSDAPRIVPLLWRRMLVDWWSRTAPMVVSRGVNMATDRS